MNGRKSAFGALGAIVAVTVLAACGGGPDRSFIGIPSASASVILSDSMQLKADGVSYMTVTVEVRDNNRNLIPYGGTSVSLATTRGVLGNLVDGNNGLYVTTLKSTQTGPATVSGVVEGAQIPTPLVVTFVTP